MSVPRIFKEEKTEGDQRKSICRPTRPIEKGAYGDSDFRQARKKKKSQQRGAVAGIFAQDGRSFQQVQNKSKKGGAADRKRPKEWLADTANATPQRHRILKKNERISKRGGGKEKRKQVCIAQAEQM